MGKCINCGATLIKPKRGPEKTYCTRECYFIHRHNQTYEHKHNQCKVCGDDCGAKKTCTGQCKIVWGIALKEVKKIFRKCCICSGTVVTYPKVKNPVCSNKCALVVAMKSCRNKTTQKMCRNCGKVFLSSKTGKFCSYYCSNSYNGAIKRHRRRHGYKGEKISILYLYKRDGGICQLCGKKVPERLLGKSQTHPDSPTIDHIIPTSLGGTHTKNNVQLAHRRCNSIKNNRNGFNEQLLLIG